MESLESLKDVRHAGSLAEHFTAHGNFLCRGYTSFIESRQRLLLFLRWCNTAFVNWLRYCVFSSTALLCRSYSNEKDS